MAKYALSIARLGRIAVWDDADGFPLKIQRIDGGTPNAFASNSLLSDASGNFGAGSVAAAPTNAEYITAASSSGLSAERVATNTATVTWDFATAGQAKANVPNLSGTNTGDQTITLTGGVTGSGTGSFAATVVTNANLTGPVTSVGNATSIAPSIALPGSPTTTTQSAGDNSTNVATTAYVRTAIAASRYFNLLQASGSHIAGRTANKYGLGFGNPAAVTGVGTLYPLAILHYVAADYPTTIDGLSPKMRIRAQVNCNDVAPTGSFTFGLYPITRPATSGGAGLVIYTIGTVVSGSDGATVSTPAADSQNSLVGSDFTPPADGQYVIAVVTTATVAASAHVHLNAILQMHYV